MFSASDIRSVEFETDRKGYNVDDVRAFLSQIADQFDAVSVEKDEANSKMAALADKIEEYRKDEDSLRVTLLGAQKLADAMVQEAREKADELMQEATEKAERLISEATERVIAEKNNFEEIKAEITRFKSELRGIYAQHIKNIGGLPEFGEGGEAVNAKSEPEASAAAKTAEPASAPEPEAVPVSAAAEPEPVSAPEPEAVPVSAAAEPEPASAPEPEAAPVSVVKEPETAAEPDLDFSAFRSDTSRDRGGSRFGKLDFGDNYSVKD